MKHALIEIARKTAKAMSFLEKHLEEIVIRKGIAKSDFSGRLKEALDCGVIERWDMIDDEDGLGQPSMAARSPLAKRCFARPGLTHQ